MNSQDSTEHAGAQGILWTLSRRILMVIALMLAFFLSAVLTIYIMFRSGDTRVPDVIGKSEIEAKSVMEAGKFEIKIQRRTDDAPLNTVIETRPAPNSSVKTNSVITIVVSSGPAQNKSHLLFGEDRLQVTGYRLPVTESCESLRFAGSFTSINSSAAIWKPSCMIRSLSPVTCTL